MSQQTVEAVLGRLLTDEAFRRRFFSDGETALQGLDLTDEEREAVCLLRRRPLERLAKEVDPRVVRALGASKEVKGKRVIG